MNNNIAILNLDNDEIKLKQDIEKRDFMGNARANIQDIKRLFKQYI